MFDSTSRAHARRASLSSRTRPPAPPMSSQKKLRTERDSEDTNTLAVGDRPQAVSRPRAASTSSQTLSKTPARSFYHRAFHGSLDPTQYSSEGVRDQTAELAAYAIADNTSFAGGSPPESAEPSDDGHPDIILEVSEPTSRDGSEEADSNVSALTDMLQSGITKHASPSTQHKDSTVDNAVQESGRASVPDADEGTPLLADRRAPPSQDGKDDIEAAGSNPGRAVRQWHKASLELRSCFFILSHPKTWSARTIYQELVLHPASLLPAVFLGLLLNILDALSYGMILFPLGNAIFDDLGSDGIAMFYVSTIISQLVYSLGGSVFGGGIGSEMIEVVPFFHSMALTILNTVGEDNPKAVLATTVLSFALSCILTGVVFFLMGAFKLGTLIGFFPRHILIGCIGGVGWFLLATAVEVSARLSGNLEYNLATLKQLFHGDIIVLWLAPLCLAIFLFALQRFIESKFLVGGYFITVAAIFYFFKFALDISFETLHANGWIFDAPAANKPWYHFYSLYDFRAVDWEALVQTIPAMFALTFFGILHVPINVPALGMSVGEDDLNVNRELVAHGISNTLSGLLGSVQNYLVYTNSLLFISSGGNDRLAGVLLAAATLGVLCAGPAIIGFIPIMVVGALIFLLGIELLQEAVVDTWGRVSKLEYATILIIIVTMGVWDFVVGILLGIILAALSFVVQTSQRNAIRATYSGKVANSLVRRPPVQRRFLQETGDQILVIKLAGFLFFGTIVGVEGKIKALLADDAFQTRPLRFLVIDMGSIDGIDYSAAEAFSRISRLLRTRDVELIVSGLDINSEIGQGLRNVGLFAEETNVEVFEDLNEALEFCENKLLSTLYKQLERRKSRRPAPYLDVPKPKPQELSQSYPPELVISSPRGHALHRAAATTIDEDTSTPAKWSSYKQPLPLLLQIFDDVSDKNEDFWFRAVPFFERVTYPKGSILFNVGDRPNGFYVLEEGIMRGEYDLPQGKFFELVVAGRPFGELPFFSETSRTATMTADKDCVAWQLNREKWQELQWKEPEIAHELLKISLKFTKERMDVITSYVLTTAG